MLSIRINALALSLLYNVETVAFVAHSHDVLAFPLVLDLQPINQLQLLVGLQLRQERDLGEVLQVDAPARRNVLLHGEFKHFVGKHPALHIRMRKDRRFSAVVQKQRDFSEANHLRFGRLQELFVDEKVLQVLCIRIRAILENLNFDLAALQHVVLVSWVPIANNEVILREALKGHSVCKHLVVLLVQLLRQERLPEQRHYSLQVLLHLRVHGRLEVVWALLGLLEDGLGPHSLVRCVDGLSL